MPYKHTEEIRNKIKEKTRLAMNRPDIKEKLKKKKGKMSEEHRKKISEAKSGEKSHLWKGGVTKEHRLVRTQIKYKIWRSNVFERDNWTCQTCGKRGVYLEAHHIKAFSKHKELRYDLNNGVTLCAECHKLTDNYKGKSLR